MTHGISRGSVQSLDCNRWDLVPRPGMEPGPPASGARDICGIQFFEGDYIAKERMHAKKAFLKLLNLSSCMCLVDQSCPTLLQPCGL